MNRAFFWIIGVIAALYFAIHLVAGYYVDYDWFKINGQLDVFWTLLFTRVNLHGLFAGAFILLFSLNFLLVRLIAGKGRIFSRNILDRLQFQFPVLGTPRRALFILIASGAVIAGLVMGISASAYWREFLLFQKGVPFSGFPADPIFSQDIGFYIYRLPFYRFLYHWTLVSLFIIIAFSALFHIFNAGIYFQNERLEFSPFSRAHLSSLLAITVFIIGLGYRLSAYQLLFVQKDRFFGGGYTAVHSQLLAYNICMIISFVAAGLLLFNIFRRSFRLPIMVLLSLIPLYFVLGVMFPAVQQRFVVDPNELEREAPYISHNIKFTRLAYGIDRVRELPFASDLELTYADIARNKSTLENIRLWDWRPLKLTYKQLQELKPYYTFIDVDVDRYVIDKTIRAVNLSARELDIDRLSDQSQTWINRHLVYTHGYGMVLSRVDKITPEGLPELLVYDIPPKSKIPLAISRPEIYYGEHVNPHVLTGTSIQPGEFDYPSGDTNKYTRYAGKGGSRLNSLLKRLLFAAAFNDINLLISSTITADTKILYRRNIAEMIRTMAPFLEFEADPYLVSSGGRLYWMIDAYTSASTFPYSTPTNTAAGSINYIRNSVKVAVDAYDGTVDYYISDEKDPIIQTYGRIFGGLFKKLSDMPSDLRAHIRYPEGIFNIQSQILLRYHMTNVNVFYNNEDAWDIPRQVYDRAEEPMHSYYMVLTLPGGNTGEFILTLPFTPRKKDNMISFLVARCDVPNYGELLLYTLPKEKLSYGPMQIEARVNQDAEISKLMTLWSQKGSAVIRGNMLVIPVEGSLLFAEPLYLKSETSEMPELKRVILAFGDRIVMEETLEQSLNRLFSRGGAPEGYSTGGPASRNGSGNTPFRPIHTSCRRKGTSVTATGRGTARSSASSGNPCCGSRNC